MNERRKSRVVADDLGPLRRLIFTFALVASLTGCATLTPEQKLTHAAFDYCYRKIDFQTVWLEHVASDGTYWIRDQRPGESQAMLDCMRRYGAGFAGDDRRAPQR